MRMIRLIGALVALALVATMSATTLTSSATAAPAAPSAPSAPAASPAASSAAAAAAKRRERKVKHLKSGEISESGRFFAKGKVVKYKLQRVSLQRAKGQDGKYRNTQSTKTNRKGKFRFKFSGPIGTCYQVKIRKTKRFKAYRGFVGCIIED